MKVKRRSLSPAVTELILVRPTPFMPKSVLAALIAVCFAGCTTDISHRAPFNSSVGRPLVTKRASFLQRDPEGSPPEWHKTPNLEVEAKISSRDYRRRHKFASIPSGQRVLVSQVLNEVSDGAVFYEGMGEIFVPSLGRFVRFRFSWGFSGIVFRAPWEGAEVPEIRNVPW